MIGLRPAAADARAARLRAMAETSVGALLLSRADGGADPTSCPGLARCSRVGTAGSRPPWGRGSTATPSAATPAGPGGRCCWSRLRAMASLPFLPRPSGCGRRCCCAWSWRCRPGRCPAGTRTASRRGSAPVRGPGAEPVGRSGRSAGSGPVVEVGVVGGGRGAGRVRPSSSPDDWDGESTVSASGRSTSTRPTATTAVPPPTTVPAPATTAPVAVVPTTSPLPSTRSRRPDGARRRPHRHRRPSPSRRARPGPARDLVRRRRRLGLRLRLPVQPHGRVGRRVRPVAGHVGGALRPPARTGWRSR